MKLDMKEIVKLGIILLIICFVSTALLSIVKDITEPKILAQRQKAAEENRKEVLPTAETFEVLDEAGLKKVQDADATIAEVYLGKKGSDIVGYFVKAKPSGYAGAFEVLTGIASDGRIVKVKMGENHETPGLGTVAGGEKFTSQYIDKGSAGSLELIKTPDASDTQISAVSGATISSRGMTNGVNSAIEAVLMLKQ